MPTYCYECKNCQNSFEEDHRIADREEPLKKPCEKCGGEYQIVITANTGTSLIYNASGKKPDEGFRDRLREVKKAHPLGKINTW